MSRALALALCLAACGRELHHTVDAPPADTIDTPDVPISNGEPPPEAVKLTITRQGAPIGGAVVVFQSPDGTVIATQLTDTGGRAWSLMPGGGSVTAIEHINPDLDELTTFGSVLAGDALRLDPVPTAVAGTTAGSQLVTVPVDSNGADGYAISTSCGTGGADATGAGGVTLESCGSTVDIVVASTLNDIPTGRAFYLSNVALPASGALVVNGTYEAYATNMLNYTNVPAQAQSIQAYQAVSATHRAYQVTDFAAPAGGTASVQLAMPQTTSTVLTVSTVMPMSGEIGQQAVYDWGTETATYSADLATSLVHAYATAPAYSVDTHAVTWTERSGGAAPDFTRAELQIFRPAFPTGHAWRWRVAAARGASASLALPALPVIGGFDFMPSGTDSVGISDLTSALLPGGLLDSLRTNIFAPFGAAVAGTSGHLVTQTLYVEQL